MLGLNVKCQVEPMENLIGGHFVLFLAYLLLGEFMFEDFILA